jgi:hypothetical protein
VNISTIDLGDGIRLLSGAMFDYADPAACAVTIGDIAGALSKICRFAGHITQFYSVAQHAVNVSRIVPECHAFAALMHDTAEAFTNDLPTPLKHAFPAFKELEARIEGAMAQRFGFAWPMPEAVRHADLTMLAVEKIAFKRDDDSEWACLASITPADVRRALGQCWLQPMTHQQAEALFLERYDELAPSGDSGRGVVR